MRKNRLVIERQSIQLNRSNEPNCIWIVNLSRDQSSGSLYESVSYYCGIDAQSTFWSCERCSRKYLPTLNAHKSQLTQRNTANLSIHENPQPLLNKAKQIKFTLTKKAFFVWLLFLWFFRCLSVTISRSARKESKANDKMREEKTLFTIV